MMRPARYLSVLLFTAATLLAGGCVTSDKSRYATTLHDTIAARPADDATLAIAMGLDERSPEALVSALPDAP